MLPQAEQELWFRISWHREMQRRKSKEAKKEEGVAKERLRGGFDTRGAGLDWKIWI